MTRGVKTPLAPGPYLTRKKYGSKPTVLGAFRAAPARFPNDLQRKKYRGSSK